MEFNKHLKVIEDSVSGVSFDCPQCGKKEHFNHCVSLAFTTHGLVDIYSCECKACGYQYDVESKPFKI